MKNQGINLPKQGYLSHNFVQETHNKQTLHDVWGQNQSAIVVVVKSYGVNIHTWNT